MPHPPRALAQYPIKERIARERTYMVAGCRDDKKDILGQTFIILEQLLIERFTGTIHINCCNGGISDITAMDQELIPNNGGKIKT